MVDVNRDCTPRSLSLSKGLTGLASLSLAALLLSGCGVLAPEAGPVVQVSPAATASPSVASPSASRSPSASPTPSRAEPAAPRIASVTNFRDVAGDGLTLPAGQHMATGVVYRSAKLATASAADTKRLGALGLDLVIDLRTDYVAARSPDPKIAGARNELVNVYAVVRTPTVQYRTVEAAKAHMREMNVDFVTKPAQRERIARALRLVAEADGPVLVHCTEGKDRTGWISALLQLVAGANRQQVLTEYLKSNAYRSEIIRGRFAATKASRGINAALVERALLQVDATYLDAGLSAMAKRYGDLDGYLTDGLGLSDATVDQLRDRLVAA